MNIMNKKLLLLLLFLFALVTSSLAFNVNAAENIEISEIMYDPTNAVSGEAKDLFRCANDSSCQWIELHNKENFAVDLSSWKLRVNTKTNGNEIYDFGDILIGPDEYIVVATQLGDEDGDGFSFSRLYGNGDGIWENDEDGFRAVDSDIPFIKTGDLGPDNNPIVDIRLLDPSNVEVSKLIFQAHQGFVQKNNGYTMEKDAQGNFVQSLNLGGSPGKKRNAPPVFSTIPNLNLNEDQELNPRLIDFRNYVSDPDNSEDDLMFSITSFNSSISNLLTCGLVGTEEDSSKTYFLNCAQLGKDLSGNVDVTISASDGTLGASKDFKIVVNPVNDAPVITSAAVETSVVGLDYIYDADASDVEGNNFTFSLVKFPSGMTINSTTGEIKWKPLESNIGEHEVEIGVSDTVANSKSSSQKFKLNVVPVFGFSNVDVDYSGGSLSNVNSSQTLQNAFTSSKFKIITTLLNRHPVKQGVVIVVDDIEVRIKVVKNGNGVVVVDDVIDSNFLLSSLQSRQLEYEFDVPRGLSEGIYKLTLEAEGRLFDVDENFRDVIIPQSRKFELLLDVQQARHDIYISNMRVDDGEMCRATSNLEVTIQNSGARTERDLLLRVNYPQLGIDSSINIPLMASGESSKQIINLTNAAGIHNITAAVTYNNGQSINTKMLENFVSCLQAALVGDFNTDGFVDDNDFIIIENEFGKTGNNLITDMNKDGVVDFADFFVFSENYGFTTVALLSPVTPLTPPVTPPPTPPADVGGFAIDVSQLKLLVQQGGSFVSKLRITNNENISIIIRQSLEGNFLSGGKAILFDFLNSFNIFSSASRESEIKASVPENFKPGIYRGTFKAESNEKTELIPIDLEVFPDFCSNGIQGEDISVTIKDPGKNDDFKPGDTIDVDMKVRNRGKDRDVTVEAFLWNIDSDEEVESLDIDTVSLDSGEDEDFEFEIDVPDDVEDDKIVLYIKASDDDDESSQCTVKSVGLDVERDKNDVRITSVTLPDALSCGSSYSIKVNAKNFGSDDAEDVFFRIANNDLGIAIESGRFELKEFDKSGDSASRILSFDVPLKSGNSVFDIDVVYDEGIDSTTRQVKVKCDKPVAPIRSAGTTPTGGFIGTAGAETGSNLLFSTTALIVVITLGLGILYYVKSSFLLKK